MTKKKTKSKNSKKFRDIKQAINKTIRQHRLLSVLFGILILVGLLFGLNAYRDWDNAQFMRGLARDFPKLVEEIEQATSISLDQTSNCSITTEKFSEGVKTCELVVVSAQDDLTVEIATEVVIESEIPTKIEEFENNRGYRVYYRNKYSCQLSSSNIYLSCLTAVREANIDLARELFLNE